MIRFPCPLCGQSIKAPDDAVGKLGKCKCGELVRVPTPNPFEQDREVQDPPREVSAPPETRLAPSPIPSSRPVLAPHLANIVNASPPRSEDSGEAKPARICVEGRTGQVELLENRIRITRRGWLSVPKVGDKEILLSAITSIEFRPAGWLGQAGYIRFVYQGGGEIKKSFWETVDPVLYAANDENAVLFGSGQQEEFVRFKALVEQRIDISARPRPTAPASMADELAKLAELRARGILTEDEFLQQKRRILQQ